MNRWSMPTSPEKHPAARPTPTTDASVRDVLIIDGLTAGYDARPIVHEVHICAKEAQIVALIGPNGAGKSTLLKAIVGIVKPTQGEIRLEDKSILGNSTADIIRQGIGFVPQTRDIFPSLTVSENLDIGGLVLNRTQRKEQRERILALFPALAPRLAQRAGTLSGGERKMLGLSRALMPSPKVVLLDEPSAGLSEGLVETVWQHIRHLTRQGITIVIVEQKTKAVLELADWSYVMVRGRAVLSAPAQQLREMPDLGSIFLQ